MLGLGFWEIVILAILALVVIGPEQLPDFAKSVAKFLNEMRRTTADLKSAFEEEKDLFKQNFSEIEKLKNDLQSLPDLVNQDLNQQLKLEESSQQSQLMTDDEAQLDLFATDSSQNSHDATSEPAKVKE